MAIRYRPAARERVTDNHMCLAARRSDAVSRWASCSFGYRRTLRLLRKLFWRGEAAVAGVLRNVSGWESICIGIGR